jgi:hypothetical protein
VIILLVERANDESLSGAGISPNGGFLFDRRFENLSSVGVDEL